MMQTVSLTLFESWECATCGKLVGANFAHGRPECDNPNPLIPAPVVTQTPCPNCDKLANELQEARREIRVAAAVIEQDGLVRIFKRGGNDSYTGKWEFPGGKLEPNETPQEALKRELREEFAVDSEIGEELDHYWYKYPKREPISLRFFAVKLIGAPEFIEHTESAWVRPEQLATYDLMNGDMKFVASRYTLRTQLAEAQKAAEALRAALVSVTPYLPKPFCGDPCCRSPLCQGRLGLIAQVNKAIAAAKEPS